MTGTIINAAGIVGGGVWGLARKKPLSLANQFFFKAILGLLTVYYGLRLTWVSLTASGTRGFRQLAIVLLALVLGKLAGRFLRLQKTSNRLGQFARAQMEGSLPGQSRRFSDGFNVCTALFCAAPLGILGAVCDGLTMGREGGEYFYPLAVKAVIDGLAAMSFISIFGWGVVVAAAPVLVFQGTITLVCMGYLAPYMQAGGGGLIDLTNAACGLLIFCVGLLIFDIKKIEVADYLPSLIFAPCLGWWLG